MMSPSFTISELESDNLITLKISGKTWLADRRFEQIDFEANDFGQSSLKFYQPRQARPSPRLYSSCKINITIRACFAACNRAENSKAFYA